VIEIMMILSYMGNVVYNIWTNFTVLFSLNDYYLTLYNFTIISVMPFPSAFAKFPHFRDALDEISREMTLAEASESFNIPYHPLYIWAKKKCYPSYFTI